jgi:hypothetical protein
MSTSNMEDDITIMEEEQQINQNNVDTLNNITNKLLLKYDSDFQHKYNTTNDLNSGIMNKEELIKMNIDGSHQKDKIISCLKYGIVFLILFSITFVLFGMKKIPLKLFIILTIFYILSYVFVIYYYVIYTTKVDFALLSYQTGRSMVELGTSVIPTDKYSCPVDCEEIDSGDSGDSDNNSISYQDIIPYPRPVLNSQSSANVWLEGDKSMNLYNGKFKSPTNLPVYSETDLKMIEPQPFFHGVSQNGATYYECKWNHSSQDTGIPMKGVSNQIVSTIPCSNMQGYKHMGTYICTGVDNNKIEDIIHNQEYCKNVEINLS